MLQNSAKLAENDWAKARDILARELNIPATEVTEDKRLREDLEVDSIIALNLIFSFEKELNLTVTEEEVVSLESVSDLKKLVVSIAGRNQHS